jgi:hypothetical protein
MEKWVFKAIVKTAGYAWKKFDESNLTIPILGRKSYSASYGEVTKFGSVKAFKERAAQIEYMASCNISEEAAEIDSAAPQYGSVKNFIKKAG